ncbi:MAG: hypothetical protein ACHQNA_10465, partial [Acidimicrobiales bacterium]
MAASTRRYLVPVLPVLGLAAVAAAPVMQALASSSPPANMSATLAAEHGSGDGGGSAHPAKPGHGEADDHHRRPVRKPIHKPAGGPPTTKPPSTPTTAHPTTTTKPPSTPTTAQPTTTTKAPTTTTAA